MGERNFIDRLYDEGLMWKSLREPHMRKLFMENRPKHWDAMALLMAEAIT